jgi:hypothetical protein
VTIAFAVTVASCGERPILPVATDGGNASEQPVAQQDVPMVPVEMDGAMGSEAGTTPDVSMVPACEASGPAVLMGMVELEPTPGFCVAPHGSLVFPVDVAITNRGDTVLVLTIDRVEILDGNCMAPVSLAPQPPIEPISVPAGTTTHYDVTAEGVGRSLHYPYFRVVARTADGQLLYSAAHPYTCYAAG